MESSIPHFLPVSSVKWVLDHLVFLRCFHIVVRLDLLSHYCIIRQFGTPLGMPLLLTTYFLASSRVMHILLHDQVVQEARTER